MTGDRSPIDVILVVGRLGAPVPVTVRRSSNGEWKWLAGQEAGIRPGPVVRLSAAWPVRR